VVRQSNFYLVSRVTQVIFHNHLYESFTIQTDNCRRSWSIFIKKKKRRVEIGIAKQHFFSPFFVWINYALKSTSLLITPKIIFGLEIHGYWLLLKSTSHYIPLSFLVVGLLGAIRFGFCRVLLLKISMNHRKVVCNLFILTTTNQRTLLL
jgi:hypothetical protein